MPEHIHVLLTPAVDQTIERCAQCIKGGFSHAFSLKPAEDFQNQLSYIAQNPTRRHMQNHRWVHTNYLNKIDPIRTLFLR
jgi:putative transposase